MNSIFIYAGLLILILVLTDFLYTTLSCNGSGKITSFLNKTLQIFVTAIVTKNWLGLIYLFLTLIQWIFLVLLGGFFVFLGSAEMVVNAQTNVPATIIERLYYTGYVFSTLGNGGFSPGNNFSLIFTFLFSIVGFGMLTIGISYLLSVTSAALVKKNLATFISSMGKNPLELFRYFTVAGDAKPFVQRIDNLIQLIDSHTNNHLSFPIVHYFLTSDRKRSAAIHLASLYETSRILKLKYSENDEINFHIDRLETSIVNFLNIAHHSQRTTKKSQEVNKLRTVWKTVDPAYSDASEVTDDLTNQFGDLLHSQGWQWKHVYLYRENS